MPRYKLTIEYDGTPFVGWQIQDNGPSVQGVLADAIKAFCGEEASSPRRRAHRRRRACARPGRPCRSRQALGRRYRARRHERASAPAPGCGHHGRGGGPRVRRALLRHQAPLPLSHHQSPRRSHLRARPRLAHRQAAQQLGHARGGAAPGRPARFHHLPRMPNARPNRRSRPSIRSTSIASRTTSTSRPRRARSCTRRCARWSARWCWSGRGNGRPMILPAPCRARPHRLRPGRAARWALSDASRLRGGRRLSARKEALVMPCARLRSELHGQ